MIIGVQDTGVGISTTNQEKIFHPFTQLEATVSRKFGGVGMGLAIVKQLLEKMDGSIQLQSEENKGTTVRVEFLMESSVSKPQNHAPIDEDKIIHLKQLMEHDFLLLVETSINELNINYTKLQQHVEKLHKKTCLPLVHY